MADERYLKKRRQSWYFQLRVPKDVAPKWTGANPIVISLKTRDLTRAQADRWPLVNYYMAQFEVLRGVREPTARKVEEIARATFEGALREYEREGLDTDALEMEINEYSELLRPETPPLTKWQEVDAYARRAAAVGRQAALEGRVYEAPSSFALDLGYQDSNPVTLEPMFPKATKGKGIRFAEAARRFIEEIQRDPQAKLTEQTRGQYEAVYRLFNSWAGEPTLEAVTRADASDFLDAVAKLDPNWGRSPATKKRTFAEILKLYGDHANGLSNRTLNRYATALNLVWKWARKRGQHDVENPWSEQHRRKAERRRVEKLPFTEDELRKLLANRPDAAPEAHSAEGTLPWLSWIAAYSGMRLNEICSLKTSDLKKERGVWHFDVTGAKTEAGDRRVPVHSVLVGLGLLRYAKHVGEGWMFPALKPGGPDNKRSWYISKAFTTTRRDLGVSRIDATGRDRVDFHSFRRSAIACLENARIPQSEAAQVVGHERAGITFGTYNVEGLDLKALRDIVEKIKYRLESKRKAA